MPTAHIVPRAPRLPVLGNLVPYLRDPLGFLCSMRERFGDVEEVALGPMKATLVHHPDVIEDILVTRNKLWQKDRFAQTLRPVLGDGLLLSEGDFWRRQRRLAQPAFHRERIAAYGATMVAATTRLADAWRDGEVRDVHKDMMRLTLEIVAETLFGAQVGDHAEEVGQALEMVLAVASDPLYLFVPALKQVPIPGRPRFKEGIAKLDAIVYALIEKRRASDKETGDLLSMLLHAKDDDGTGMSNEQLRDECMTLFLAGHETTALALSWTWLLLSENPGKEAKLAREVASVLGDRAPTLADLPNLRYASSVVAESLRLYPPAWSMGREAREDVVLAGFHLPKGTQVWFSAWAIQRDPRWFDKPHDFVPERWAGDFAKTLHKYAYFPFGGGPRLCIGQAFAQMEAVLLLATLVQRFKVEVLDKPRPDPSVTLRPTGGMRAHLVRRARSAS